MDESDPLSEQNKIPLGHNCTYGAVYSKIKLRSALHFNHYNHSFHDTFAYNEALFIDSDYLLCTGTASAHIIC